MSHSRYQKTTVSVLLIAALVGWWVGARPTHFAEEVALANGKIIDIERMLKTNPFKENV